MYLRMHVFAYNSDKIPPGSGFSAIDVDQGRFHEAKDEKAGFYHRSERKKEGAAMH